MPEETEATERIEIRVFLPIKLKEMFRRMVLMNQCSMTGRIAALVRYDVDYYKRNKALFDCSVKEPEEEGVTLASQCKTFAEYIQANAPRLKFLNVPDLLSRPEVVREKIMPSHLVRIAQALKDDEYSVLQLFAPEITQVQVPKNQAQNIDIQTYDPHETV